jgi:hypothetical protein
MPELVESFVWTAVIATVVVVGAAWLLLRFVWAVLVMVWTLTRARRTPEPKEAVMAPLDPKDRSCPR